MKITVFTPTYNRVKTLERLYLSLKYQKFKEFEWIIVDDGSTDDTEEFVANLEREDKIKIKYFKQKNGGKHRAINKGVELAQGKLFFIVDSDDYLTENALDLIIEWEKTIDENDKSNFAGISGMKMYEDGKIVGKDILEEFIDATNLERDKYGLYGDKSEIYYTSILKKYKFPEIENEIFLTEAVVWNRIAFDKYKIRWFREPIYICAYLEDGLSRNREKNEILNWKGTELYLIEEVLYGSGYRKFLMLSYYIKLCKIRDIATRETIKKLIKNKINIFLICISYLRAKIVLIREGR